MRQGNLKAFIILCLVYLSAFFIFQMNASAHETQCPPCNCNGAQTATTAATTLAANTTAATAGATAATAQPTAAAQPAAAKPAPNKPFKKIYAVFATTSGTFKVLLFHAQAPKTVENFVGLVEGTKEYRDRATNELIKRPFYNGLKFHRVRKGFFIQSGDPSGDGTGGPGFAFNDEFHPALSHSKPGIVSMASSGPNQNGSQFFISLVPRPDLDKKSTIFGEIASGLEVAEAISKVPVNRALERPLKDVLIQSVTIVRE